MSDKPRSVLKKGAIPQESRKVHFATPVASEKQTTARKKPLPIPRHSGSTAKKARVADVNSISISNKQSEIMESIRDVETKFMKQTKMTMDLANELTAFTDSIATVSSEVKRVCERLADTEQRLQEAERQKNKLIEHAGTIYKQLEIRAAAQSTFNAGLEEFQNVITAVNCSKIDSSEVCHVDFEHLFNLLDKLGQLSENI